MSWTKFFPCVRKNSENDENRNSREVYYSGNNLQAPRARINTQSNIHYL